MSEVSRARALITIIRRDLPGLLPGELDEGAAAIPETGEVLTALLRLLPPELRASIEQDAAALQDEIRPRSKTGPEGWLH
jgi:hypothetical protein